ncbi:N-acetyltransferase [Pantoea sp. S61]|uniref:peptidogalycan biosysnthesis protein n=1 Tax=Pantoea sp. S61 TaxID=2767442 RepID=UPI00190D9B6D|nr:peptidogalycan biosysnthesis protein [Pantoea sp. S61]MBK0123591.1 N-acetyltransferase [Pantoea sp. S61]
MFKATQGFDEKEWAKLQHHNIFQSSEWISSMASRLPGEIYTFTLSDEVGILGVIISQFDAYEAYNPQTIFWRKEPVFSTFCMDTRQKFISELDFIPSSLPALVLVFPGYDGNPSGKKHKDQSVISDFVALIIDWAKCMNISGVHSLYTFESPLETAFKRLGGQTYDLTTRSVLNVTWNDWNDYLQQLSANRRSKIKKEYKLISSSMKLSEVNARKYTNDIVSGRCSTLRRYGNQTSFSSEKKRLESLIDRYGDNLKVFGAIHKCELIASSVCVLSDSQLIVIYNGVSDAGNNVRYSHFASNYYAIIQNIDVRNVRVIDYGISHKDVKELRGCKSFFLKGHVLHLDKSGQHQHHAMAKLMSEKTLHTVNDYKGSAYEK